MARPLTKDQIRAEIREQVVRLNTLQERAAELGLSLVLDIEAVDVMGPGRTSRCFRVRAWPWGPDEVNPPASPETIPDPHQGHDGETLAQAVDRLGDNIEDPFDRHTKARGRMGWKDIGHSIPNVFVALTRERPKFAGKTIMYGVAVVAVCLVVLAVVLL